jgi:hypothetical protein
VLAVDESSEPSWAAVPPAGGSIWGIVVVCSLVEGQSFIELKNKNKTTIYKVLSSQKKNIRSIISCIFMIGFSKTSRSGFVNNFN